MNETASDNLITEPRTDVDTSTERRQSLEHMIRDAPADVGPYLELAAIHRLMDKPFEAQKVLEKASKVASDNKEVKWELEEAALARSLQRLMDAKDLHNRHPTPEATEDLERAQVEWALRRGEVCRERLMRDPSQVHLNIVLAEAMYEMGQYDDAIEALEPALSHPEESPKAYLMRGLCLQSTDKQLEALSSFRAAALRRAVTAPPNIKLSALRHAADLAMRMGLRATAKRYLRGIVQLSPADEVAKLSLARLEAKGSTDIFDEETIQNAASRS